MHVAGWIVGFQAVGFLLGFITKNNISSWYGGLIKSELTPPPFVFSIVWPLLYLLLACLGWRIWKEQRNNPNRDSRNIWFLFITQMIMNWLWTPIFFQFHFIGLGLIFLFLLIGINSYISWKLRNKNLIQSLLFLPYILWLIFATYLNATIYWLN